jgi:integrase
VPKPSSGFSSGLLVLAAVGWTRAQRCRKGKPKGLSIDPKLSPSKRGVAIEGPIFGNTVRHPLDLNACYQKEMKDVLKRAGISWHGWHGFRRGLASNLNHLGVDDSVIQRILRHSTVATTQNHHIKPPSPDAIAAMKQFSEV